jgi:hypothetical protein
LLNLIGFTPQSVVGNVYRASRDGFAPYNFHSKCDNVSVSGTLTIFKSVENIFGGFTRANWYSSSPSSIPDSNAFLFSLTNLLNYPVKLNIQASMASYAIFADPSSGPCFGKGYDLCYQPFTTGILGASNLGYAYQLPLNYRFYSNDAQCFLAGNQIFQISEIEVYSINCKYFFCYI